MAEALAEFPWPFDAIVTGKEGSTSVRTHPQFVARDFGLAATAQAARDDLLRCCTVVAKLRFQRFKSIDVMVHTVL